MTAETRAPSAEPPGVRTGDDARARFLVLYDEHAESVYRYLLSRLGNPAEAQDLASQAILAAWQKFSAYREDGHASAWLMSIARSKLVDFLRREKRRPVEDFSVDVASGADTHASAEESERRARLREIVRQLPDDERELLRLRYSAGMPLAEIAAVLGRSEEAVKKAHQRLVGRLRSRMEAGDE
jgi:RNA polymerase sigma-70 factor (ECF subfamily)